MTTKKAICISAILGLFAASTAVYAHPGHDVAASYGLIDGLMHPLSGLDHIFAMVAVGLWATQIGGRALWVVPMSFVAMMIVGGMLGVSGIDGQFAEPLIAASVLAFGSLIATRIRFGVVPGMVLVGAFAVFHGIAHTAELPGHVSVLDYGWGFVFSTTALHLAGLGLGMLLREYALAVRVAGAPIALTGAWMMSQLLV